MIIDTVNCFLLHWSDWEAVDTVDIDAEANRWDTPAGGLLVGITLSGFDPTDELRLTMPTGGTYVAWSPWGIPSPVNYPAIPSSGSVNWFQIIKDGDVSTNATHGDPVGVYDGYEAARAAFVPETITGASSYTFYIQDSLIANNSGGLSILVEKRSLI